MSWNVVDALAAGQDFTLTRVELREGLAEYEATYGPLTGESCACGDPGDCAERFHS